jgi:hypothetical protein
MHKNLANTQLEEDPQDETIWSYLIYDFPTRGDTSMHLLVELVPYCSSWAMLPRPSPWGEACPWEMSLCPCCVNKHTSMYCLWIYITYIHTIDIHYKIIYIYINMLKKEHIIYNIIYIIVNIYIYIIVISYYINTSCVFIYVYIHNYINVSNIS